MHFRFVPYVIVLAVSSFMSAGLSLNSFAGAEASSLA